MRVFPHRPPISAVASQIIWEGLDPERPGREGPGPGLDREQDLDLDPDPALDLGQDPEDLTKVELSKAVFQVEEVLDKVDFQLGIF